jgi:hypothetical protein
VTNQCVEIILMKRKRFQPLVRIAGPKYVGMLTIGEHKGPLYLDELSNWLWMASGSGKGVRTDEEVATTLTQNQIVRFLIYSASDAMALFDRPPDRIEAFS